MKKLITILLFIAALFSAVGCSTTSTHKFNSTMPNAIEADLIGYTNLENSDGFMEITSDDVIAAIDNKNITAYVFMGSTNCHYCQDAIVQVQKQAITHEETVYYLSMDKIESKEKYNVLVKTLTPILKTNDEGKHVLYIPHLFMIIDGELVDGHLGFKEGYDYTDVFTNETLEEGR